MTDCPPVSGEPPGEWEPDDELAALPIRPPVSGEPPLHGERAHGITAGCPDCRIQIDAMAVRPPVSGEPRDCFWHGRETGCSCHSIQASTGTALDAAHIESMIRVGAKLACEDHYREEHLEQVPPCAGALRDARYWADKFGLRGEE